MEEKDDSGKERANSYHAAPIRPMMIMIIQEATLRLQISTSVAVNVEYILNVYEKLHIDYSLPDGEGRNRNLCIIHIASHQHQNCIVP